MNCEIFCMFLLIPATSFLIVLFLIKHRQTRLLPPGPKKLPLIGNLHQLDGSCLPHLSLERLSNQYDPIMFLQLGSIPTLVISSADVARDIFKSHDVVFSGRPDLFAANKFSYGCKNISFAPYGDYWREVRKIAILELLSSKRVQTFHAVRSEEVDSMLQFIVQSSGPINLSRLTLLLANNIVCRATFGKKFDDGGDSGASKLESLMRETQALLGTSSVADFFPWMEWINKFNGRKTSLEKYFTELDKLLDEQVQEHHDPKIPRPEHEDLVDVLLRVQKDSSQVITLTNDHIKAVLNNNSQDIFLAGTDTSSATLTWAMTELLKNSSAMERAQNEVRGVVKGKDKVEEDDLPKLMYLKLVLKEALRLHPPAPLLVPRETTQDCTVGGYTIPSKTRVIINAKAIATDLKHWENPYEFRPERFLNSSIDFKGQHFELIPFGVGRRGCPGMNFAIPLVELALANLLYRFDWKLPPEILRSEDLDMEEAFGITMHKKTHLCLVASPASL
ncbi:hypothetical protein Ddye_002186 [Dipteronia dyeriana]|uniref:Cytochrome P450 n=1 Tax=Dipteronia dyeriana TaxID=168575 RepID=A0AAE0CU73_9ROSI|nr:hypothetical protein Ddye_002186 [Dipteronia dyeriana]